MNPSSCCSPCSTGAEIINVPGVQGEPGADGTDGADGLDAFSTITNDFLVPPKGDSVSGVKVANSDWMINGSYVYVYGAGIFQVLDVTDATTVSLTYLNYSVNTHSGDTVLTGSQISPSGNQVTVTGITDFTDNTLGVVSNTLAIGVGRTTLAFFITASVIANGDLLTNYVPGYKFKIVKFDARCAAPVTTGAKAANINLEIGTTDLTGGVIALAGTYIQGAAQAGTTVSGANEGNETDSISIEASGVTAFTEGAFWLILEIQNMDSADAFASIADKINDLLAALAP